MARRTSVLPVVVTAIALLACKAISSSSEQAAPAESSAASSAAPVPEPAPPPSMTGVYDGVFTSNGKSGRVVGVVMANGDARFVADGDVQNVGKLTLSGLSVRGTLQTFSQGVVGDTVMLDGTLAPERSIAGTFTAPSGDGTFLLSYSTPHRKAGNLTELEGTWKAATGFRMTVDASGAFTGRDASACRYSGTFRLGDPDLAVYAFELNVKQCAKYDGSYAGHAVLTGGKLAYGVSGERFARSGYLRQ